MHLRIVHINYKEGKLFCSAELLLKRLNLNRLHFLSHCHGLFCLYSYLLLLMLQCHAICHCLGHSRVPYLAYGHDHLCHAHCGRHGICNDPYHVVYHRESSLSDCVPDSFPSY